MIASLVSIIIPTRNRAYLLEKSIRSCLDQTYKNIEVIVVDDFSTDSTPMIIKQLSDKDNRIIYIRNDIHQGLPASRNIGLFHAHGEYIFFSEDDLILSHNAIEILLDTYVKLSPRLKVGAIAPRLKLISNKLFYKQIHKHQRVIAALFDELTGEPYPSWDILADGIMLAQHLPATALIPRKVFKEIGTYYTGYKFNYLREETEIYLRMFKRNYSLIYQPKAVAFHIIVDKGGCRINSFLMRCVASLYNHFLFLMRMYGMHATPMLLAFLLSKILKVRYWNNPRKMVESTTLIEKAGLRKAYWKTLTHYLNILKSIS
jgi:glycosyltransferase involved in cell wall biosynthesis